MLGRAGRLPEPDRAVQRDVQPDIERAVDTVLDVFRRYEVPVEAQREIHDLIVRRL